MALPEPEYIDGRKIRRAPICHESLSPELLEQIQAIYQVVGSCLDTTLEQFEIEFMRDTHPQCEVAIWRNILAALHAYHERFGNDALSEIDEERELLAALIAISMGVDDVEQLCVPVKVGSILRNCYNALTAETSSGRGSTSHSADDE